MVIKRKSEEPSLHLFHVGPLSSSNWNLELGFLEGRKHYRTQRKTLRARQGPTLPTFGTRQNQTSGLYWWRRVLSPNHHLCTLFYRPFENFFNDSMITTSQNYRVVNCRMHIPCNSCTLMWSEWCRCMIDLFLLSC